jgi:4'-phosphopantetheinyl transferase
MRDIVWLSLTSSEVPAGDGWLSAAERAAQARLFVPKRRNDWRLGRYTAKRALATWLAAPRETGEPAAADRVDTNLPPAEPLALTDTPLVALAQLEVLPAPDGAPEAWRDGGQLPVSLSISHSLGHALVAVAPPDIAVGCDIERVEPRSAAFIEDYFTPHEQGLLRTRPAAEQALWATLIWSAKESALKALREGLRLPARSVEVRLPASTGVAPGDAAPERWHGFTVEVTPQRASCDAAWRRSGAVDLLASTLACLPRACGMLRA